LEAVKAEGEVISIGIETGGYEMPGNDQALSQADVTQANQGISAGDRAMGRGNNNNPMGGGMNTPNGSSAASMAMRNSSQYSKFADPIRFWVKAKLKGK
jgi:hypothetical protein